MKGSIRRYKGAYEISVELPITEDGKRQRHYERVRTKKEADRRLVALLAGLDKGQPPDNSKITVASYLEIWLRDVVAIRNRPRTQISYATIIKHHIGPPLGHISLAKLQPLDVGRMEAQVVAHQSACTAHHVHIVLSKTLKDAMRKGLVARNVCQHVDPPRVGAYEVKPPDMDAVHAILEETDKIPYATAYRLAAYTGVRRGEVVALRWRNVNLEQGVVSIVEEAQRLPGKRFEKATRKAGHPGVRLHDLRHFHAMTLIAAKAHPRVVQERLGHASAAFTMQVYGHVAAGLQQEAADAFAAMMDTAREKAG